jgi:hypothetical protein
MLNAGDPASAEAGVNPEIVGAGFTTLTVKPADPPPGFEIRPLNVRGLCKRSALRLKTTVVLDTLPCTDSRVAVAPENPVPSTVTVTGTDPAATELGFTRVIDGVIFELAFTRRGSDALVPPPGAGLVTDT